MADMEVEKVADMEEDKVADIEVDMVAEYVERVGHHRTWLIGPKLFYPGLRIF